MKHPVALTIAGSDSCGGAGLQADLRVFAALGVRGVSVVAAVTAQNAKRVRAVEAVKPAMGGEQLAAVFDGDKPKAAKAGMLLTLFGGTKHEPKNGDGVDYSELFCPYPADKHSVIQRRILTKISTGTVGLSGDSKLDLSNPKHHQISYM